MSRSNGKEPWSYQALQVARRKEAGASCRIAGLLFAAYRFQALRSICLKICNRLENGVFYSKTLRDILQSYHDVTIGRYSYGPIMSPGAMPRGTIVGNFCSVGAGLVVLRRNHPLNRLTQHPFFYNKNVGYVVEDTIPTNQENPLTIGHDVWIGERVTILAGCTSIGNGAVIAAGSVVTHDVQTYSVVAGVPAKKIKSRFPEKLANEIEETQWWNLDLVDLLEHKDWLLDPMTHERAELLKGCIEKKRKKRT